MGIVQLSFAPVDLYATEKSVYMRQTRKALEGDHP